MVKLYVRDPIELDTMMALHGLTTTELAKKVDIVTSYMSSIKNGSKPVGRVTAAKIAKLLNKETEDIFFAPSVDNCCTS